MPVKKKEILSKDFTRRIFEFSGGYFNEDELRKLFSLIESEAGRYFFTHSSESNLLRFISSTYDKISFLSDCLKYPHYLELLVSIAANSNYLTDILVRNPEYFYIIANPSTLDRSSTENEYRESALTAVNSFRSFSARLNALRRYKRKEILRIGARDIFLQKDIDEITAELSSLAKTIASLLFSICYNHILNKYRLNLKEDRYCLISLGKLGGNELNYSSDIDLIIFYDENETLPDKKEFQEVLTETVLLFIESASSLTEYGYIYRIDFRLRPDGKNSPLCRRFIDYIVYYESRGEDWERQMLIKSDFVSGNIELFRKFKEYLRPFVFPVSFKSSPIEQIKKLKLAAEKNLKNDENIKLVPGGIRDIEFSVQALQLINGGKIESLRTGNTFKTIGVLQRANLLTQNESDTLKVSYIFYRKIEHYLQLMNDVQTHLIPPKGELLNKLSNYLGFRTPETFLKEVNRRRIQVLKIYNSVTGKDQSQKSDISGSDIRYLNPQAAGRDLLYLKEGKGLLGTKEFDRHSTEAFDEISSSLYRYLKKSGDPDLVLNNFVRVIRSARFPSIWYDGFRDRKFFNAFLTLCECSQSAIDFFAEDKTLREIFLSKRIFDSLVITDNLPYKEFIFLLVVQFTLGLVKSERVPSLLSEYFRKRIGKISESLDKPPVLKNHYFIGAMGSFGNEEMTFASDIDLVFITDNLEDNPSEQKLFVEFLSVIRDEFKPVTVDCRLRPEGKTGMLVWDLKSYMNYISTRARIWELQAFTKFHFVSGNKKLFNKILMTVRKRIKSESPDKIKTDLKEMRRKLIPASSGIQGMINLKKNSGGVIDIEFIVQYLILCNPHLFEKFRTKNINRALKNLIITRTEYSEVLNSLRIDYQFLKTLILYNQNIFHQTGSIIIKDDFKFIKLSKCMGLISEKDLEKNLFRIMRNTSSLFTKFFGR